MVSRKNLIYGVIGLLVVVGIILGVLGGMGYFKQKGVTGSNSFTPPPRNPNIVGDPTVQSVISNVKLIQGGSQVNNQYVAVQFDYTETPPGGSIGIEWGNNIITLVLYYADGTNKTITRTQILGGTDSIEFNSWVTGLNEMKQPVSFDISGQFVYTDANGDVIYGPKSTPIHMIIPTNR
jgi:hypothetical protein